MKKLPPVPGRTTPGFVFSNVERAIKDCLALREFRKKEVLEVLAFFGNTDPECAFCGSLDVARWDHLVSINQGGETVIGNMVLPCARCDDSKQHYPYEEWMLSPSQGSPTSRGVADVEERLTRIKAYTQFYNYTPRQLSERLTPEEQAILAAIRTKLLEARQDLAALIASYRARTGHS